MRPHCNLAPLRDDGFNIWEFTSFELAAAIQAEEEELQQIPGVDFGWPDWIFHKPGEKYER